MSDKYEIKIQTGQVFSPCKINLIMEIFWVKNLLPYITLIQIKSFVNKKRISNVKYLIAITFYTR